MYLSSTEIIPTNIRTPPTKPCSRAASRHLLNQKVYFKSHFWATVLYYHTWSHMHVRASGSFTVWSDSTNTWKSLKCLLCDSKGSPPCTSSLLWFHSHCLHFCFHFSWSSCLLDPVLTNGWNLVCLPDSRQILSLSFISSSSEAASLVCCS